MDMLISKQEKRPLVKWSISFPSFSYWWTGTRASVPPEYLYWSEDILIDLCWGGVLGLLYKPLSILQSLDFDLEIFRQQLANSIHSYCLVSKLEEFWLWSTESSVNVIQFEVLHCLMRVFSTGKSCIWNSKPCMASIRQGNTCCVKFVMGQ